MPVVAVLLLPASYSVMNGWQLHGVAASFFSDMHEGDGILCGSRDACEKCLISGFHQDLSLRTKRFVNGNALATT